MNVGLIRSWENEKRSKTKHCHCHSLPPFQSFLWQQCVSPICQSHGPLSQLKSMLPVHPLCLLGSYHFRSLSKWHLSSLSWQLLLYFSDCIPPHFCLNLKDLKNWTIFIYCFCFLQIEQDNIKYGEFGGSYSLLILTMSNCF